MLPAVAVQKGFSPQQGGMPPRGGFPPRGRKCTLPFPHRGGFPPRGEEITDQIAPETFIPPGGPYNRVSNVPVHRAGEVQGPPGCRQKPMSLIATMEFKWIANRQTHTSPEPQGECYHKVYAKFRRCKTDFP